jgi:hypothetical protein
MNEIASSIFNYFYLFKVATLASEVIHFPNPDDLKGRDLSTLTLKKSRESVQEHVRSPHLAEGVAIERFKPGRLKRKRLDHGRPFISTLEIMAAAEISGVG